MSEEEKLKYIREAFERNIVRHIEGLDDCWRWKGSHENGYGILKVGNKAFRLHRASWMIHRGPIPPGHNVKHTCGKKICSNPEHLFLEEAS